MIENYETVYEAIKENLVDGALPKSFRLSREEGERMQFADGAKDGVRIYHMDHSEIPDYIFENIEEAVQLASEGSFREAEDFFDAFLYEFTALELGDLILQYIFDNRVYLNPSNIYEMAKYLLTESSEIENIKIGLLLFGMFPNLDEEERQRIKIFALSDEFTYFCIYNMSNWKKGNEEIFEIAQKTKGWGRIHAIEALEPRNKKIREWLLYEGIKNTITPEYSALLCFEKADIPARLERKTTKKEFAAIGQILSTMLIEGPVRGISGVQNPSEILNLYLDQAEMQKLRIEDYNVIHEIYLYAKHESHDKEVLGKSKNMIFSDDCIQKVKEGIEQGKSIFLAEELKIPYKEELAKFIESDFKNNFYMIEILLRDPEYTDKVLEIIRKEFPPESIIMDPQDKIGFGEKYQYCDQLESVIFALKNVPQKGVDYFERAVRDRAIRIRLRTISVLKEWVMQEQKPLRKLSARLYKAARDAYNIEPVEEVRLDLKPLIDGEIFFDEGEIYS